MAKISDEGYRYNMGKRVISDIFPEHAQYRMPW